MATFKRILNLENYIFTFFILFVFYGAINSPYSLVKILLGKPKHLLVLLPLLIILLLIIYKNKKFLYTKIQALWHLIKAHDRVVIIGSLISLFLLQLLLLTQITVPIGWDVFDNFHSITTENKDYSKIVLSLNPNNEFFFFMMYYLNKFLRFIDVTESWSNTWFSWQVVNCLFINSSLFLFYHASKRVFNPLTAFVAYSLFFLSFGLSPWLLTPYTDTAVLLFINLVFFAYSLFDQVSHPFVKYCLLLFIGIGLAWCFLMKPSSIIFFIAFSCIKVLQLLLVNRNKQSIVKLTVVALFLLTGFASAYYSFQFFVEKQTITEIDKEQAKPWTLFVMMGLTGTGGYNDADTQAVNQLPTQEAKKAYTIKMIQDRLKNKGFFGYLRFLAQKNRHNTSNGDFDWGWDGGDLIPETPSKNRWQEHLRSLYYPQNQKSNYLRIYMHFFYLLTLLGLLFSIPLKDSKNNYAILKLAFIGAILYLLLFEGGRSRYLIQFMPFWYLLSASGWLGLREKINAKTICELE